MAPLTSAQVDELEEGTEVVVTWAGGNGPHRYRVVRTPWGTAVDNCYEDLLTFVGPEQPFTTVRLAAD